MESTNNPKPVKQTRRRAASHMRLLAILLLVIIIFCSGVWASKYLSELGNFVVAPSITKREKPENDGNAKITDEQNSITSVAEKVSPSVVSIVTKKTDMSYFGPSSQEGAGTGVIVGKQGYVLTNKHVVNDADNVQVVASDGTVYEDVKVLGADPLNDIAFLKINKVSDLPVAELGDSTTVRVGQRVVAIGNSLGQFQNTVTSGIISGTGRPIMAQGGNRGSVESLTDLFQTDTAINPGNSGGPLLNLSGQVIGINTAIAQGAEGIGFSIPVNATKGALKGVLAGKKVDRSFIGVSYLPITATVAKQYDLSVKEGAYIYTSDNQTAVAPGSPAEKAGIKKGDVITEINDIKVGKQGSISTLIGEYAPGDTVKISYLRGGKLANTQLTLASYSSFSATKVSQN